MTTSFVPMFGEKMHEANLSQAQFFRDKVVGSEGVTMGPNVGDQPLPVAEPGARGYVVGGASHVNGERVGESRVPTSSFSHHDVLPYVYHVQRMRREGIANSHLGGWASGGDMVLDASNVFSKEKTAQSATRSRGEEAYFDMRKGQGKNSRGKKLP